MKKKTHTKKNLKTIFLYTLEEIIYDERKFLKRNLRKLKKKLYIIFVKILALLVSLGILESQDL